jgi:hypothetical protein
VEVGAIGAFVVFAGDAATPALQACSGSPGCWLRWSHSCYSEIARPGCTGAAPFPPSGEGLDLGNRAVPLVPRCVVRFTSRAPR